MQSGREDSLEKQYVKKFCFKLGEPSCMNGASVFEWHKRFKEGREYVRDYEGCGRNKEVNTPELIGQRVSVTVTLERF